MWSISIYSGNSPFELTESEPVLTGDNVTDIRADFVADPFMLRRGDTWHMFFEVMNAENQIGEIGVATSTGALEWSYESIVLKEPFHLSYPHVFESNGEYFMLPETLGAGAVCLYKAADFPFGWTKVARLIEGQFADPTIIRFDNLWWLFACSKPYQHDTLRLYFAPELTGPWTEHRRRPLITNDTRRARPAGRVIEVNNRLIRFAQDCVPQYGSSVRAFEILELTTDSYREVEINRSPILKATGNGWNAAGMHHIDAHQQADGKWIACVDGTR
jgi:hypothetical protein